MMTPQQYCKRVCKRSGSNFVLTFYLLGAKKRRAMEAFYAFCREVDDAVDEAPNEQKAKENIRFWKEEVPLLYQGKPRHLVTQAIKPILSNFQIPQEYLSEIVLGCEMDISHKTYATFAELERYCYRVASCVGLASLIICGVPLTPRTKEAGIALGKALQITNILRDIRSDLGRGRLYLPQEDLEQCGVAINDLNGRNPNPLNLMEFFYHEIERAQNFFKEAWKKFPASKKERRKILAPLLMGKIYEAILDKISRDPMRVFQEKIKLSGLEKLEIAGKEIWNTLL